MDAMMVCVEREREREREREYTRAMRIERKREKCIDRGHG